jgi:hypothetical protein
MLKDRIYRVLRERSITSCKLESAEGLAVLLVEGLKDSDLWR